MYQFFLAIGLIDPSIFKFQYNFGFNYKCQYVFTIPPKFDRCQYLHYNLVRFNKCQYLQYKLIGLKGISIYDIDSLLDSFYEIHIN